MGRSLRCLLACALAAFVCAGCNNPDRNLLGDAGGATSTLSYALTALPELPSGYRYEGWLKQTAGMVSVGKFDVLANGSASPASVQVAKTALASATAFVVTVEPAVDTNPGPSATKILAGDLTPTGAILKVSDPNAIGSDFASATGKFMLATPTTGDNTKANEGIWWIDPSSGTYAPGLSLPTLPAGWKYEAWVDDTTTNQPVSTGKFIDPAAADDDGAGAGAAAAAAPPPFPGDDFVNGTPLDLTSGYKAVVSVEPDPDPSGAPFAIKVLRSDTITSAAEYTGTAAAPLATAANIAASTLPQGTVTVQ